MNKATDIGICHIGINLKEPQPSLRDYALNRADKPAMNGRPIFKAYLRHANEMSRQAIIKCPTRRLRNFRRGP